MKIAIQENLLPGKTLREKFLIAEKLGFDGIELWGRGIEKRISEIESVLSISKVPISTICSGYKGDLLGSSRSEREAAIKDIKFKLEVAAKLNAVGLIVVPTFGGPKLPDLYPLYKDVKELEYRLLVEELKDIGKHADEVGVFILLEPLNRYETHFLNRLEQAIKICKDVNMEHVKIMADFFHMNIEEASIPESLKIAKDYIRHIHLADSNRWLPGFGHTDFKSAFKVLKNSNYKYFMALECYVPEPKEESLRKSLAYLKSLL